MTWASQGNTTLMFLSCLAWVRYHFVLYPCSYIAFSKYSLKEELPYFKRWRNWSNWEMSLCPHHPDSNWQNWGCRCGQCPLDMALSALILWWGLRRLVPMKPSVCGPGDSAAGDEVLLTRTTHSRIRYGCRWHWICYLRETGLRTTC